MYSMETFLPYNLNKAERERDPKKVMTLGPFADALKDIYPNAHANGPRDITFFGSLSLSALFKLYGRNVSIEYMNNIDFVITESGLVRSAYLISS